MPGTKFKKNGKKKYRRFKVTRLVSRITPEKKCIVNPLDATFSSVANAWIELDVAGGITQGTNFGQRDGRRIMLRSIEIKGVIIQGSAESAVDDAWNCLRMVLGVYTGQTATPLTTAAATINTPITRELYTRNFLKKKLIDKYFALPVMSTEKGQGDGYAPGLRSYKYFKKLNMLVDYGDDTATYPSIRLILSMVSDSIAVVNPGWTYGYILTKFSDV